MLLHSQNAVLVVSTSPQNLYQCGCTQVTDMPVTDMPVTKFSFYRETKSRLFCCYGTDSITTFSVQWVFGLMQAVFFSKQFSNHVQILATVI